jgi:hypothetical protein
MHPVLLRSSTSRGVAVLNAQSFGNTPALAENSQSLTVCYETHEPRSSGRESAPSCSKQCQSRLTSVATVQGLKARKNVSGNSLHEPSELPQGFGVRQSSGALDDAGARKNRERPPQSKTLPCRRPPSRFRDSKPEISFRGNFSPLGTRRARRDRRQCAHGTNTMDYPSCSFPLLGEQHYLCEIRAGLS